VLAIALLADACAASPGLALLEWHVTRNRATTDLTQLAKMHVEGTTLVITPSPDALPLVNKLHAIGWQRDGWEEYEHMWKIFATLTRDGATLEICGITDTSPANGRNAIPYFADPPPELPRRISKKFRAEYAEWDRKCHAREW
jgi:hypothetical protein